MPASRISRCSTASKASASEPSSSSRCSRRRHFLSMERLILAPCPSTKWPRQSTPISRADKGFLTWEDSRYGSVLGLPSRPHARKVWKTVAPSRRAVALASAAIHSPPDAANGQPNRGQAPGRLAELVNAKLDGPAGGLVPPCATTQRVAVPANPIGGAGRSQRARQQKSAMRL